MKKIDIKYGIFSIGNDFFDSLKDAIEYCERNFFVYSLADSVRKWQRKNAYCN